MRLLVDECVESSVIRGLREKGFEVDAVSEINPGTSDTSVLQLANETRAILLTADKDFGELVFRQGRVTHGIILIRLHGLNIRKKAEILVNALKEHQDKLIGSFSVIEPTQVRITRAKK